MNRLLLMSFIPLFLVLGSCHGGGTGHPPIANDDTAVTFEHTMVVIYVLENDSDSDGDTLVVSNVGRATNGLVVNNGSDVTYSPIRQFIGNDSFNYTISDENGNTDTAQVTVIVNRINTPPVADSQSISTAKDTAVAITLTGSDGNGDPLTYQVEDPPEQGYLSGTAPDVTYIPNEDYVGSDSFTFVANDGITDSAVATVSVSVLPNSGSGIAGYALKFDGSNDFVELVETASIMDPGWESTKTVSLWLKPLGVASSVMDYGLLDAIISDKPRWWSISRGVVNGLDRIWVWNYDNNFDVIGIPYTVGEWIHIAMVHGSGRLKAYKNGIEQGNITSGPTVQPSTGALPILQIGSVIKDPSSNFSFEGEIDEVQIWNLERSTTEIIRNIYENLIGNESGLAAYYKMSDGSGSILTDDGINSRTGILTDGCCGVPADGSIEWVQSGAFGPLANMQLESNGQSVILGENIAKQ